MQPQIIRTWCALIFVLSFASPVTGQHLLDGAEDWYLEASDGVDLYVVEFGAAAGDTVVVLHGGWGASTAIYDLPSYRLRTGITLFSMINGDLSGHRLPTAPFLYSDSFLILRIFGASSDRSGSRFSRTRWGHVSLTRISGSTPNTYVDWRSQGRWFQPDLPWAINER